MTWLRLYVFLRWVRLTTRRYGVTYLARTHRPRHAGVGRAPRDTFWGRAHGDSTGWNITTGDIAAMVARERELVDV